MARMTVHIHSVIFHCTETLKPQTQTSTTDSKATDKDTYLTQHVHTVESNLTPMVMYQL